MNSTSSQSSSKIAYDKFGVIGYNKFFINVENVLLYIFSAKKKSHLSDFVSFLFGLRYTLLKGIFFLKDYKDISFTL